MCNKLNDERRRASRDLHLTPSRTRLLVLGLVIATAGWLPPLAQAQVEIDVLGGNGLEASMSSSLLSGFQEVTESLQSLKESTAFPDSSAMVGRIFQIKLPNKVENSFMGEIVQISEMGKNSLPAWLHWDSKSRILQGLPLEKDKGIHYISVSISNQTKATSSEVFFIEVHPDDYLDADSAQMLSNQVSVEDDLQPFMCEADEPVTVLTVILDADLTKMSSEQRVELMDKMRSFSGVGLHYMRMLPVVNNRLFDMSAFMAGPGNAKKVVENGALLSWKLGCSLDQSTVPNLDSVQGPAKEGTMSTKLGYPVVGWHIANKKPGVPKRVRRQLNNTPTPILAVVPPATAVEPPVRIIPTLSSPSMAAPTESFAPPIRGPVPLPGKPTPRVHEPTVHTPTMDPPLPTKVMETTSTIQPTGTRPIYVEPTATPTPSTKKPPKKPKKPKSTPVPKVPSKSSTTKPPRRTTSPPSISPDPSNEPPVLRNAIDRVYALVGTYFEVKIPSDTFFDIEDGTTDKLRLTLKQNHDKVVEDGSWIQFNTTSQLLYGLPDLEQVGEHVYYLHATDKGGRFAVDAFEVYVSHWPQNKIPVIFKARFQGEPRSLKNDIHKKILLVKKLAYALGDRNSSTVSLTKIEKGSILVEWTNTSLQQKPCPKEQLAIMSRALADASGNPSQAFRYTMEPEFRTINVTVKGTGSCAKYSFIPPEEYDPMPSITQAPDLGSSRGSTDDVYLHTVIPAVVVAAILLIAGVIAMICYRKKRKGKLTIEDQATFIKKGVPIIFADELDDSKPPPSSSMPLILQEEKPPLPPPEYPNMATPETTPLNHELLGEYTALKDEDPNAPPYQPPPPFATPMEGKGSRPKNMTPYRSPPPYVPP